MYVLLAATGLVMAHQRLTLEYGRPNRPLIAADGESEANILGRQTTRTWVTTLSKSLISLRTAVAYSLRVDSACMPIDNPQLCNGS
jgi:hypothetical protein